MRYENEDVTIQWYEPLTGVPKSLMRIETTCIIDGIKFEGARQWFIDNLIAWDNATHNIVISLQELIYPNFEVRIKNCEINNGAFNGILFAGNEFETKVIIEQNIFNDCGYDTRHHALYCSVGSSTIRPIIRNNWIDNAFGGGVMLYNSTSDGLPINIDVYGNVITNCYFGVLVSGNGHKIINNTFGLNRYNIYLWREDINSGNHLIEANITYNANQFDLFLDPAGIIDDFTVINNQIGTMNSELNESFIDSNNYDMVIEYVTNPPVVFSDFILSDDSLARGILENNTGYLLLDENSTSMPLKNSTSNNIGAWA